MDYKEAGVDIEKGEALVDWLQQKGQTEPHQDKILHGIGGFASIFKMDFPHLKKPCLVAATDGIGTKLKIAIEFEKYDTLGQDLVAMCANDLICTGAQPLFFLDYFATSHLDLNQAQPFLKGLRQACHQAQMALIGGETAEMPGLYGAGDFDCAGFALGVVDQEKILGAHGVKPGDQVIGVESSGFHSNGFSLLRKLFSKPTELQNHWEELLTPTALYVDLVRSLCQTHRISAIAHITGGGILNLARVLPEGLGVLLKPWEFPPLTLKAQELSAQSGHPMTAPEMLKTFNCGIGLALVVPEEVAPLAREEITSKGFKAFDLGVIEKREQKVEIPSPWPLHGLKNWGFLSQARVQTSKSLLTIGPNSRACLW